jgi:cobalamin 5'-phosphate synthase/cobalamin synthase
MRDGANIGRAAAWFPLVGLVLGGSYVMAIGLLGLVLPSPVAAGFVVGMEALLTGGLHMDGLADTADGLGGGWSRKQTLDIMRDPAIGTYGSIALVLLIVLKVNIISTLIERPEWIGHFLVAPVLGRWSSVLLSYALPYARQSEESVGGISRYVGVRELGLATFICLVITVLALGSLGLAPVGGVLLLTALWGGFCRRRLGGVTGDTLGTGIVCSELFTLLIGIV